MLAVRKLVLYLRQQEAHPCLVSFWVGFCRIQLRCTTILAPLPPARKVCSVMQCITEEPALMRAKASRSAKYAMTISQLTVDKLGVKLYDKVSAVLAELVANSYDAERHHVRY